MNKIHDHKYKLGQNVWIETKDGIPIEVSIVSILLMSGHIVYQYAGGDFFDEDEVIEPPNR